MNIIRPPRLSPGDVIGLAAPASPPRTAGDVERGVRYLEACGYRVKPGRHIEKQAGFCAGTDTERAADLHDFFFDPQVRAIFVLRGGYGTPRLLPLLDYRRIRRHPKILVGYSDITALQLALLRRSGLLTFAGPMVAADMARGIDPSFEEQFWRMLTSGRRPGRLIPPPGSAMTCLGPGRTEGVLLPVNLSLLMSAMATPFLPSLTGTVLLIEELGEPLHRIDRMFTQLRNAGVLRNLGGLVFGQFTACHPLRPDQPHLPLKEILCQAVEWSGQPALAGVPYGHERSKWTLPVGGRARLDAGRCQLTLLEPGVS